MFREAKAHDMVQFTKFKLPEHWAGWVYEEQGEVIGMGALVHNSNRPWLVLDITERARHRKVTMHRIARMVVKVGLAVFGEVFVMRDQDEPGSEKWLGRLGFVDTGETHRGEIVMRAGG